jgi:uncharacterized protein (TIGR00251 family)
VSAPAAQITVRVQTRAARDELVGWRDDVFVVRLSTPPIEGRANRALCRLIARAVRVAPSRVAVVRGERSRDKVVRVEGLDAASLREALRAAS